MRWPWSRSEPTPSAPAPRDPLGLAFSTDWGGSSRGEISERLNDRLRRAKPRLRAGTGAMDAIDDGAALLPVDGPEVAEALFAWYGSQTFIGWQMCAILSQHWLIDKACRMPAQDAVRHGFDVKLEGYDLDSDELKAVGKANKKFRIKHHLQDLVYRGRTFGIRIAIFKVKSRDPRYYEKPFNPDGVTPGSYQGIVQVDPYWCTPDMDMVSLADPASLNFYEPTWWTINGRKYHRSHLIIYTTGTVPDMLKPLYGYGGVPLPQKIMERVYAAERTANEAPQLAMTKRLTTWNTDLAAFISKGAKAIQHVLNWTAWRDNYGVKINDTEDKMEVFDTTLAHVDEVIMGQYQLVAAIAETPAVKLLSTTPKGFNATGEFEEASYHETLETIQENDMQPLLERHLLMVMRSVIEPKYGVKSETTDEAGHIEFDVDWAPLDSPTAKEYAEINKLNAEADNELVDAGAIDGMDVRARIAGDRNSGYTGLAELSDKEADELMNPEPEVVEVQTPAAAGATPAKPKAPPRGKAK